MADMPHNSAELPPTPKSPISPEHRRTYQAGALAGLEAATQWHLSQAARPDAGPTAQYHLESAKALRGLGLPAHPGVIQTRYSPLLLLRHALKRVLEYF